MSFCQKQLSFFFATLVVVILVPSAELRAAKEKTVNKKSSTETLDHKKYEKIPLELREMYARHLQFIRTEKDKSIKLKKLAEMDKAMNSYSEGLQKGKNDSYVLARYYYYVMKPVLELSQKQASAIDAKLCDSRKFDLLYADHGNDESGNENLLPETKEALELLRAVCPAGLN